MSAGRPEQPVFPRSSNKPQQAVAMLRAGADLTGELLAVAAASHSGEELHVGLVRELLGRAGSTETDLGCPLQLPLNDDAAHALLREGGGPDRLHMNCSGKHAGMLLACRASGWPIETYLDPEHPLQQLIGATIAELAGEPVAAVGVDGCGAPQHAISLTGLARTFARLATSESGSAERRVADAMRAYPEVVGGTGRDVTLLMQAVPGLLAKDGAEGVYAAAMSDGRAVALKIDDGAGRARPPVLVATLHALGVKADGLAAQESVPVLGGGRIVGAVKVTSNWR